MDGKLRRAWPKSRARPILTSMSWVMLKARRLGSNLCSSLPHGWCQMSAASRKCHGRKGRQGTTPRQGRGSPRFSGEVEFGWDLKEGVILMQAEKNRQVLGDGGPI